MSPESPALRRYWLATRPYSFTAAAVPALLGSLVAVEALPGLHFGVVAFGLTLLGCVAIQAVANVVNDLYDARTGLDRPDNYGRLNCIVSGLVTVPEARRIILAASGLSLLVGVWFLLRVGLPGLWLLIAGGLLAFFYTAPPLRLKHRALGDVAVALGFGLGMVYGAFLAQAAPMLGRFTLPLGQILTVALPSLLLVVGILHANNHRDRAADAAAGARTLANVVPLRTSDAILTALLLGPYAVALVAAATHVATRWWPLVLLSLPVAIALARRGQRGDVEGMYVPEVAKLHGLFGLLTTVALLLGIWTGF